MCEWREGCLVKGGVGGFKLKVDHQGVEKHTLEKIAISSW